MTGLTPISKLSAKHTTAHVAHPVQPPGSINGKGQLKWQNPRDPEDVRFISLKEGRVLDPQSGAPVKAPKT